jgi:hypothetical protein
MSEANNSLRAKALAERKKGFKYMAIESIAIEDVLNTLDRLERLESERAMMREALEFYATTSNYQESESEDGVVIPVYTKDTMGNRARDTLKAIEREK